MKVRIEVRHGDVRLHENTYEVSDADSFGKACAHAWEQIHAQKEKEASSIGALMEVISENVLDELESAEIRITRIR